MGLPARGSESRTNHAYQHQRQDQFPTEWRYHFLRAEGDSQSRCEGRDVRGFTFPYTLAGITINEADPDVAPTFFPASKSLFRPHRGYRHTEGNAEQSHQSFMMGSSVSVIVENGRLVVGTCKKSFFANSTAPAHVTSTLNSNRLLKNAHLRRCPHPSSLRRTTMYVSLLGISGVLYLSVFEQPAGRVFSQHPAMQAYGRNQRLAEPGTGGCGLWRVATGDRPVPPTAPLPSNHPRRRRRPSRQSEGLYQWASTITH